MIDGLPVFVGNCVRAMLRKGGAVCCGCCMGAECWVYLQLLLICEQYAQWHDKRKQGS